VAVLKASGLYRLLVEESINVQSWIIAYPPNDHLILEHHPLSFVYLCLFSEFTNCYSEQRFTLHVTEDCIIINLRETYEYLLTTLALDPALWRRMVECLANREWYMMWKKAVMV
jgi:hypothetical protein